MPSLFISYAHVDMKPTDWLERLTLYLAPLRKRGDVEIWADSKLEAGDQWKSEIDGADPSGRPWVFGLEFYFEGGASNHSRIGSSGRDPHLSPGGGVLLLQE